MSDAAAAEFAYRSLEEGLAAAQQARAAGRLDAALAIYATLRTAFADRTHPHQHAAALLLDAARYDEADALLNAAMALFPTEVALFIDSAWLAHRRRDVDEAVRRWDRVREQFPDHPVGYTGAVVTLRDAGRLDAAEALLAQACARFPDDPAPVIELAWMAMVRRDWPLAIQRWETVRARFADHSPGYTGGALAQREAGHLAEADALLRDAIGRFPNQPQPLIDHAQLAAIQRQFPQAVERWDAVLARFPTQLEAYTGKASALREMRRFDDTEAVLTAAMALFPGQPSVVIEHAWITHFRRDWGAAVERWDNVRALFPDMSVGYTGGAIALREAGRAAEAEALLLDAERRFPQAIDPPRERAALAQARQDWEEASRRWAVVRERFPAEPAGYLGGAVCLREMARVDEAGALLQEAVQRFPDQAGPALELAWLNNRRRDFDAAIPVWDRIRRDFPNQVMGFTGGAQALRDSGRKAEAKALLETAQARFPTAAEPTIELGWLALTDRQFLEAEQLFAQVCANFIDQPVGPLGLGRAQTGLGRFDEAESALRSAQQRFPWFELYASDLNAMADRRREWAERQAADPAPSAQPAADPTTAERLPAMPAADPARVDPKLRDFVMRFESLGGSGAGWEFGMVQRACGAEPMGLLRWADMPFEMLVGALEQRFVDVGHPDMTELFVTPDANGVAEYCSRDLRGMMAMRTFVAQASVTQTEMFEAMCRRLQYHASKLIQDLTQGGRIFVYRLTDRNLTRDELARLHAAMRAFGENTLLFVRLADDAHPDGMVETVAPGLMIGYMDRFIASRWNDIGELPMESWLSVLGNADAQRSGPEIAALPTPAVVAKPAELKVVLCGYHNAHLIGMILTRLPPLKGRISYLRIDPGPDIDTIVARLPPRHLETADVYFEESMVGNADTRRRLRESLPGRCDFRSFPTPHMTAQWPFLGRDDRLVPDPPVYNGGRYANTDRIAARLAGIEMTDDALFDAYMEMTEADPVDMDAQFAADMRRWQAEDERHDVKLSAFIEREFRAQRLFTTPNERGTGIVREVADQLLQAPLLRDIVDPTVMRAALDRLTHGWLASRQELPVHPRAARHFGLSWWDPDMRYRMLGTHFTFREYIVRYIRWSPWLA